jgi:hypothetical protein
MNNMVIDLHAQGREVQFMDSKQDEVTQLFGKGLADINATVKSRGDMMTVRADATLLSGSNITYVMMNDISQLQNTVDEDMVTFTDFNQQSGGQTILVTGKGSSATNILVNIDVEKGAIINAFLSDDGQNRAVIDGVGRLKYNLDFAGRDNLNGTYNIESGNVRYTPPLLSQKSFDIKNGCSITWSGEMLNPQLNLKGTERLKAGLQNKYGSPNLGEFIIDANVGGSLNNIELNFDLTCENNTTVQSEIQSMADIQRSQAAINLLLYNSYMPMNSSVDFSGLPSSALFSFLQSQLNNWAAQTLPGIDLSFGINQYVGNQSRMQTSYSYRLAKSLFNDRFKIVVGGEYKTEMEEDENVANNLFNDISLEYYMNDAGNRYLKLFRQITENVFEGRVTSTGVAYVLKRKLTNLKNLFTFKHSREYLLRDSLEKARKAELKLQEKARKDELKLQEDAIDAMSKAYDEYFTPADDAIDRPTVNRKKDDESEP